MHKQPRYTLQVLTGRISQLMVDSTTLNLLDRDGDREGMAATGVLAAAIGLSGPAAGMAMMSVDEMEEPVVRATFELNGWRVEALLSAWPFEEGDEVAVVGSTEGGGLFAALAVLDERKKIIALYPHVSAGSWAHWARVLRYSLWVGVPMAATTIILFCIGNYALDQSFEGLAPVLTTLFALCVLMIVFVGYRIGRRFTSFVGIAESVFVALGWKNVKWINLRKDTAGQRLTGDPVELGDTYFRY